VVCGVKKVLVRFRCSIDCRDEGRTDSAESGSKLGDALVVHDVPCELVVTESTLHIQTTTHNNVYISLRMLLRVYLSFSSQDRP